MDGTCGRVSMRRAIRGFTPKALQAARKKAKLSPADLARLAGVGTTTIRNWESGSSHPAPPALKRACEALDMPIERVAVVPHGDERIADYRVRAGLTQADLAKRTGLPATTVGEIERGHTDMSDSAAAAIAQALGLHKTYIQEAWLRGPT